MSKTTPLARTLSQQSNLSVIQTELIARLQHEWIITRAKDLLLVTTPLWLVDTINIILDLQHYTSVLLDKSRPVFNTMKTLRALQSHRSVLSAARVDLEGILVRVDVELNTTPRASQSSHGALVTPVVGSLAVVDVRSIITGAVVSAVPDNGRVAEVGAELRGGCPEIVDRAGLVG